jgi:hypothetical protein
MSLNVRRVMSAVSHGGRETEGLIQRKDSARRAPSPSSQKMEVTMPLLTIEVLAVVGLAMTLFGVTLASVTYMTNKK